MSRKSLKLRLLAAQALAMALALVITGAALVYLFERHVERRIGLELDTYVNQLAARVSFNEDGTPMVAEGLADPRFERIFSGLYWQVLNETTSRNAHSRSLWDAPFTLTQDAPAPGGNITYVADGPKDQSLLVHERRLFFPQAEAEYDVRLAAAVDRASLSALVGDFSRDVAIALLILAGLSLAGAWMQVSVGLKPLAAIREGIAAVRGGHARRLGEQVPSEVAPLVEEVNALLEAQEHSLERARARAADLAHGLKTPLTALLSDAKRLRERGETAVAGDIEETSELMRRQIERELARARMRDAQNPPIVLVDEVVEGIVRTVARTPDGESRNIEPLVEDGLSVRIDGQDLAEVLGNLVENAVRHAKARVLVRVHRSDTSALFEIEDDGPGIADEQRERVLGRGQRLDSTGAGLGLAIVREVLEIYGSSLALDASPLGGVRASFSLDLAA